MVESEFRISGVRSQDSEIEWKIPPTATGFWGWYKGSQWLDAQHQ